MPTDPLDGATPMSGDPLEGATPAYPVSYPSEVPERLQTGLKSMGTMAKQAAIPTAANIAGAGLGGLAGGAVAGPPGALVGGITGAGLANVATSKLLPEFLGGQPKSSAGWDFAWGAGPQALTEGATGLLNRLFKRRLEHAGAQLMEQGQKQLLDPENLPVQEEMLTPPKPLMYPQMQSGPALTQATNDARGPIQQIIQQARTKYGKPIGDAYRTLKGDQEILGDDAEDIAGEADALLKNMVAPGPKTARYAQAMHNWSPTVQREAWEAKQAAQATQTGTSMAMPDLNSAARNLGYKSFADMPPNLQTNISGLLARDAAQKQMATMGAQAPAQAAEFKYRPPNLDQLRNMRQQINADLQGAKGGDIHGLTGLQDTLDNYLMDYLPDNMNDLRTTYRGFIKRWGYERTNELAKLRDPNEVAQWAFKDPRDAHELFTEATTPEQQNALRERFVQYAWGNPPPGASAAERANAIRKRIAPYAENPDALRAMMGRGGAEHMGELIAWGRNAPDLKQQLEKNPHAREMFQEAFNQYFLNRGQKPSDATISAMSQLMGQAGGGQGAIDITASTPFLPPISSKGGGYSQTLAVRHGALGGMALAMLRPEAAVWQGIEAVSWLAHHQGFTAASKLGATRTMLNAFKAKTPMEAGWWLAHSFDGIIHGGAQYGRQLPVEQDYATQ